MIDYLKSFFQKNSIQNYETEASRESLIQNGRIVVIDDETPLIIEELQSAGFSVDHDKSGDNLAKIDSQLYDVAIIDFHGVGQRLGPGQGLDLLKHIKRVSPRTRLIAYTSRSLNSAESEFFRLSHFVLPKDQGLVESMAQIEDQLSKAFSKEYLFDALIAKLNVSRTTDRKRIEKELIKALHKKDSSNFKTFISRLSGQAAEKSVEMIINRIF